MFLEKLLKIDFEKLTPVVRKTVFLNLIYPGLGFFYSGNFLYGTALGIIPTALIGLGIKYVLIYQYLTFVLWIAGIFLHLVSVLVSPKVSPKKTSFVFPAAYLVSAVGYLFYTLTVVLLRFAGFYG